MHRKLSVSAAHQLWTEIGSGPRSALGHERRPLQEAAAVNFRCAPVATEVVRRCDKARWAMNGTGVAGERRLACRQSLAGSI
jgi:hypothetical protein